MVAAKAALFLSTTLLLFQVRDALRCTVGLSSTRTGGRFREQYYWDSFWILEGLLESELYGIANDTLQNFMDELDTIGFIPNGGRIYCKAVFSLHPA